LTFPDAFGRELGITKRYSNILPFVLGHLQQIRMLAFQIYYHRNSTTYIKSALEDPEDELRDQNHQFSKHFSHFYCPSATGGKMYVVGIDGKF